MKIALDISPLHKEKYLQHRVRGTGFYIRSLKDAFMEYFPRNNYVFFTKGEKLPNNLDVVHFPYFEPFFLSLPFIKNCKNVVTVHDLTPLVFPEHFPSGIRGRIKWFFQKIALQKVDAIITDSKSSKNDIIKYTNIPDEKVHVVYLAADKQFRQVNNDKRKHELKKKYHLPEEFVLYVGDVTWNKNLPRLLTAMENVGVPIVMVGKALKEVNFDKNNPWNSDVAIVQKMAKDNKEIILLGFVPTEELVLLYNVATVFAMPSLYEGFGLPILEAMSCGCPVVTTRGGSLKEVAGDAAVYVNAYNPIDITKGIQEILENRSKREYLRQKGFVQVKKFSWKKTAQDTMKVYEKKN